jgi:hypothetical protein
LKGKFDFAGWRRLRKMNGRGANMIQAADPISLMMPRALASEIIELSSDLTDRMHELLERNTDDLLTPVEKAELRKLVSITEIGQIVAAAMQLKSAS